MLPRPDVSVNSTETDSGWQSDVVISREGSQRSYRGGGNGVSRDGATVDVIRKILDDPFGAEWLPENKR